MKKLVSILLALILALGLTVSAFAALPENAVGKDTGIGEKTENVTITVNDGQGGTVYYVTVEWSSLEFTYQKEGTGTWNPETHTYSGETTNTWADTDNEGTDDVVSKDGNTITRANAVTIKNHSNAEVKVETETTSSNDKVTVVLTKTSGEDLVLTSADVAPYLNDKDKADTLIYSLTLTLTGTPDDISTGTVGTIKVKISPNAST